MAASEHLSPEQFTERFLPGEYQRSGAGWDEVESHPAFNEPNPSNPQRVHAGTMPDLIESVRKHGIRVPVEIDPYNDEVAEGHHRVIAAIHTGRPIPWRYQQSSGQK
jgi:hypothetical protein